MFGIGFGEILVIGFLAFMLIGPKGMPDMAKQFGKWFVRFRRVTFEVKSGVDNFMRQAENELRDEELADLRKELSKVGHDMNDTMTDVTKDVNDQLMGDESHLYPENIKGGHHGDEDHQISSESEKANGFETPLPELNPPDVPEKEKEKEQQKP